MSIIGSNVLAGASGQAGYNLNNSLRFRSSASAYLNRTPTTPTNGYIWTYSVWFKRGTLGVAQTLLEAWAANNNTQYGAITITSSDTLTVSGWTLAWRTTTQVFRDPSAWYHLVVAVDTTQATGANRVKVYINGSQVTSFGTSNDPTQNTTTGINTAIAHSIGSEYSGTRYQYFDGYLTEINFIDGQALTPSSFGSTNATTGVWQPAKYTGTYGTNGFYLPFTNSNATGFSSYYGSFNGSNQYLTFTGNTGLQFGTGDFTVEYWMYQTSVPSQVTILDLRGSPTTAPGTFGMTNTGIIYYNGTSNVSTTGFTPTANTWAHVAFSRASGVMKVFVNGVQYYSGAETTNFNTGTGTVYVGRGSDAAGYYMAGYVSNLRVIKGTALYTANFTPPTSALTAVSGTQLLMLQNATFVDNSSNAFAITNNNSTTSVSGNVGSYAQINRDTSGNNNHWAMSNINYTASGTTYDAMTDSPTLTSATVANYPVWNAISVGVDATLSSGNLNIAYGTAATRTGTAATMGMSSGKYYWEISTVTQSGTFEPLIGIVNTTLNSSTSSGIGIYPGYTANGWGYDASDGNKYTNATGSAYGATWTSSDVIGVAFDADNGTLTFYKNNTSQGTAFTGLTSGPYFPAIGDGSTAGTFTMSANFGQRPFTYTPPTGFVALNTFNLPTPTILQGNKYMDATLYTGTGASLAITNAGAFQPDFVWVKGRSGATSHALYDSVRGTTKDLVSDSTAAETTQSTGLTAFGTGGFTVGALAKMNTSAATYVGWQWQAGQGSTSSNTSGSITSTVSVNTTAGFSVVTYTGTGANATVGHGLGVAPKFFTVKRRSAVGNWMTWHTSLTGSGPYVILNSTNAAATGAWNNTLPTSTVFSLLGSDTDENANGSTYVAYCWAEIAGFSKFGSYTGNGSTDGPFVYLGFRPKFIMIKDTTAASANNWIIFDSSRNTYNQGGLGLYPNLSNAEDNGSGLYHQFDFVSNGIKFRSGTNSEACNQSGETYIYAAFAENPFKYANAR